MSPGVDADCPSAAVVPNATLDDDASSVVQLTTASVVVGTTPTPEITGAVTSGGTVPILAILCVSSSVNHMSPSGPAVMPPGPLSAVGIVNGVTTPAGVTLRDLVPENWVNQMSPSGPAAISAGRPGAPNSVTTPDGRDLGDVPAAISVNQRFPSSPATIPPRCAPDVGTGNSANDPAVVIFPTLFANCSVNQRFPSGPVAMRSGSAPGETGNSVKVPDVVTLPIAAAPNSANHRLPSGLHRDAASARHRPSEPGTRSRFRQA